MDSLDKIVENDDALIDQLDQKFQVLRKKILDQTYKNALQYPHLGQHPGRKEEFMSAADRDHEMSPYPGESYFRTKMLPTLKQLASNPQELEALSADAFLCLDYLMSMRGRTRTYGNLVRTFFEPVDLENDIYEGKLQTRKKGQFQYFYQKYGRLGAIAAAIFQGSECDLHYDGWDYSYNSWKLDGMFSEVLEKIPPAYWNDALEAFIAYGGSYQSKAFWDRLPPVVAAVIGRGKEHLLPWYFRIAKAAPRINSQTGRSENFPVLEPGRVVLELQAIESVEPGLRDAAVDLASGVIKGNEHVTPTFLERIRQSTLLYGPDLIIPTIITELKSADYSEEKIKEIFALTAKIPHVGYIVLENYPALEKKFPGGIDALLEYLEDFKAAPRSASSLIYNLKNCPEESVPRFLAAGRTAVKSLGDNACPYFSQGEKSPSLSLLKESPEEYEDLCRRAIDFAKQFGGHKTRNAEDVALSRFLENFTDPRFTEFTAALKLISDRHRQILDERAVALENLSGGFWEYNDLKTALEAFLSSFYALSADPNKLGLYNLPGDVNFLDQAKILVQLSLVEDTRHGGKYETYLDLVKKGLDYRVAAAVRLKDNRRHAHKALSSIVESGEVKNPLSVRKTEALVETILSVRRSLADIYNCQEPDLDNKKEKLAGLDRRDLLAKLPKLSGDAVKEQFRRISELEEDPEIRELADFTALKKELEQAQSLSFFKSVMDIGILKKRIQLPEDGLLMRGNSATRTAIASTSLMVALGAMNLQGVSEKMEKLPLNAEKLLPGSGGEAAASHLGLALQKYESVLMDNLAIAAPEIERMILEARKKVPGLMPIGGKIHTPAAMHGETLNFLRKVFGLDDTWFHLIHAGESLVLPPMPSALELRLLITALSRFGVINYEYPDYQSAAGGRLPGEDAAVVGASILLSTTKGVSYGPGAFSTTHNHATGKRIMAYDAGVKVNGMPFDLPQAEGRTDMLGRHDLFDADRYQILSTLANHQLYEARFGDLGSSYGKKFARILENHGLISHLYESAWIFEQGESDTLEQHEKMVASFTDEWHKASGQIGFGIISEVNWLINEMKDSIKNRREETIAQDPLEYEKLLNY